MFRCCRDVGSGLEGSDVLPVPSDKKETSKAEGWRVDRPKYKENRVRV